MKRAVRSRKLAIWGGGSKCEGREGGAVGVDSEVNLEHVDVISKRRD